jgi:hypothetical protein
MSEQAINGWHKITNADGCVMILHFIDGVSERGYEAREYTRFGGTIEPVAVTTPQELAVKGVAYDELNIWANEQLWAKDKKIDALHTELADVLEVAIARGDSLGYSEADDDYRARYKELTGKEFEDAE